MLAQYFSGIILDRWGISRVYDFYFVTALAAAILYFFLYVKNLKGRKAHCKAGERSVK